MSLSRSRSRSPSRRPRPNKQRDALIAHANRGFIVSLSPVRSDGGGVRDYDVPLYAGMRGRSIDDSPPYVPKGYKRPAVVVARPRSAKSPSPKARKASPRRTSKSPGRRRQSSRLAAKPRKVYK